MAINFGSAGAGQPAQNVQQTQTQQIGNVTLDLNKTVSQGLSLDLNKVAPSLENILVGLGWDQGANGETYDLDLAAIMKRNHAIQSASDIIFFNNKLANGLALDKDNRTGAGDGDDEKITGKLSNIPADITDIYFVAAIFEAQKSNLTFNKIRNSYIRLVNTDNNSEVCNYILRDNYSTETFVVPCKLERTNNGWQFKAVEYSGVGDLNVVLNAVANNQC